ncbi:MAG: lipoyl synthase [Candidatus Omnitrophica bacterium]|nr:lipoyl synthase [Candidatus Omnitrophota bacterium]
MVDHTAVRKPAWLNKKINLGRGSDMKRFLAERGLNTVCQSALCPNIAECFGEGTATFLILGPVCTRGCKFCAVTPGVPDNVDPDEPRRVSEAVKRLGLKHVVITSVTRDDMPDGGAGHFNAVINAVRSLCAVTTIEVLVPDFNGRAESVRQVLNAAPDIFGHNLETVPRLYGEIRTGADYGRSLDVLKRAKAGRGTVRTKSGLMLGLGEQEKEVLEVLNDLSAAGCDYLCLGQYLAPSKKHYPVKEYVSPERFSALKTKAEKLGFLHVASAPYVRSSYRAAGYNVKKTKVTFR